MFVYIGGPIKRRPRQPAAPHCRRRFASPRLALPRPLNKCIHKCMCIYIYIYIYMYTYIYINIWMDIYIVQKISRTNNMYIYITYTIYLYINLSIYIYMYIFQFIHMFVYIGGPIKRRAALPPPLRLAH